MHKGACFPNTMLSQSSTKPPTAVLLGRVLLVVCGLCVLQDVDWEFQDDHADDDMDQGASDDEAQPDDPGYRKQLGERNRGRKGLQAKPGCITYGL